MTTHDIATALQRVDAILRRRPEQGLHDDAPASARWQGGLRVIARHADGAELATDMPAELGGSGSEPTPGWLFRAGIASCAATTLVMQAASQGIALTALEVSAHSRSDARGMFGIDAADGAAVQARPLEVRLRVRISAPGVAPEHLRAFVEAACLLSPIPDAVRHGVPMTMAVDVDVETA